MDQSKNVSFGIKLNPPLTRARLLVYSNYFQGPIKARAADLSLSLPTKAKLSGLSQSVLDVGKSESKSLGNLGNKTSCDHPQGQNKKKDLNVPNVYSSYPVSSQTQDKKDSSSLAVSDTDVSRKMGQGYSTTVEGQVQLMPQNANSARSLPPTVPNTNKSHSNKKKGHPNARHSQSEADKSRNRSLNRSKSDSDENLLYIHTKHDSGFYSATQLSREEMYDYGFKKDLEMDSGNMTSSPRGKSDLQSPERIFSQSRSDHLMSKDSKEKTSRMKPEGQTYKMDQGQQGQGRQNRGSRGSQNGFYTFHGSVENLHNRREQPLGANRSNNCINEIDDKENIPKRYGSKLQLELSPGQKEQPSQANVINQQAPSNSCYGDREVVLRKSAADVKDSIKISIENGEPVLRAKSLGDLQTGCAFSIVGQRKSENDPVNEPEEFTGSKLTAYYRKIREMKKESKHGSLPFRGRNVDLEGLSQVAEKMESQMQEQTGNQQIGFAMKTDRPKHYGSLQHLPMTGSSYSNTERESRQVVATRKHIKTPMKPKRCLPQVPADTDQKKRQVTDVMKVRMSAGSQSSSSPSSSQSNRAGSSEGRYGFPPNTTPADREVSDLLDNPPLDNTDGRVNNNVGFVTNLLPSKQILPSELYSHPAIDSINNSTNLHGTHPNQHFVASTGGRLSESGQTTLTSQSTIDSGYATNDPDHEMIPTSIYAKSLKQSAQSLYKNNKLLKPSKDLYQSHVKPEHLPIQSRELNNPDTSTKENQIPQERTSTANKEHVQMRHVKDVHTQDWVNKLQSSSISGGHDAGPPNKSRHQYQSLGSLSVQDAPKHTKMDNNNNARHSMTRLTQNSMSESFPKDCHTRVPDLSKVGTYPPKRQQLSHHPSELSVKDIERMNQEHGQIRSKGKSLSMAQGLNLIDSSKDFNHGLSLAKTHPKFTGSLKDLIGVGKQIVPVEILKREDFHQSTGTLFTASSGQQETSLKSLGKPSLFQVLQNYNLYTVRMQVPEHFSIVDNIRMIECEVVLPSSYIFGGETPLSPKGNYAKIGGPNSAFRPVVSGISTVKTVSMVTVLDISEELIQTFHTGQVRKGDLIIEVRSLVTLFLLILRKEAFVHHQIESICRRQNKCHSYVLISI